MNEWSNTSFPFYLEYSIGDDSNLSFHLHFENSIKAGDASLLMQETFQLPLLVESCCVTLLERENADSFGAWMEHAETDAIYAETNLYIAVKHLEEFYNFLSKNIKFQAIQQEIVYKENSISISVDRENFSLPAPLLQRQITLNRIRYSPCIESWLVFRSISLICQASEIFLPQDIKKLIATHLVLHLMPENSNIYDKLYCDHLTKVGKQFPSILVLDNQYHILRSECRLSYAVERVLKSEEISYTDNPFALNLHFVDKSRKKSWWLKKLDSFCLKYRKDKHEDLIEIEARSRGSMSEGFWYESGREGAGASINIIFREGIYCSAFLREIHLVNAPGFLIENHILKIRNVEKNLFEFFVFCEQKKSRLLASKSDGDSLEKRENSMQQQEQEIPKSVLPVIFSQVLPTTNLADQLPKNDVSTKNNNRRGN